MSLFERKVTVYAVYREGGYARGERPLCAAGRKKDALRMADAILYERRRGHYRRWLEIMGEREGEGSWELYMGAMSDEDGVPYDPGDRMELAELRFTAQGVAELMSGGDGGQEYIKWN